MLITTRWSVYSFLCLLSLLFGATASDVEAQVIPESSSRRAAVRNTQRDSIIIETDGYLDGRKLAMNLRLPDNAGAPSSLLARVAERVLDMARLNGYYTAQLDTIIWRPASHPSIYIRLREGRQLPVSVVSAQIPDSLKSAAAGIAWASRGSPQKLEASIHHLLRELGERGYPFARMRIAGVSLDSTRRPPHIALELELDPGPLVRIAAVQVIGLQRTRLNTVLRELNVRQGDLYRESMVREMQSALSRLGYFRRVAYPELFLRPDGLGLLRLHVEEGNANTFNGILGYNPPAGARPGFVSGLVDVKFGNLFGTGRRLAVDWQRRGERTQELGLQYREPWLLHLPIHVQVGFHQLFQDTLYIDRRLSLQAEWSIATVMHVLGKVERATITPDTVAIDRIPGSQSLAAGFGLRYDSTDDPVNPRRGAIFFTSLESISRRFQSGGIDTTFATRLQRLLVDAAWLQLLAREHVFSLALHWRQFSGSPALNPLTDIFRFGGAKTLRGYREEQFQAARVAWANIEYRYLLAPRSRVFLFFDAGFFSRHGADAPQQILKIGYGFGARIETRVGIVGIDYGLGEGDGLLEGKVHISLINNF